MSFYGNLYPTFRSMCANYSKMVAGRYLEWKGGSFDTSYEKYSVTLHNANSFVYRFSGSLVMMIVIAIFYYFLSTKKSYQTEKHWIEVRNIFLFKLAPSRYVEIFESFHFHFYVEDKLCLSITSNLRYLYIKKIFLRNNYLLATAEPHSHYNFFKMAPSRHLVRLDLYV